jgi:hypothetical protein
MDKMQDQAAATLWTETSRVCGKAERYIIQMTLWTWTAVDGVVGE